MKFNAKAALIASLPVFFRRLFSPRTFRAIFMYHMMRTLLKPIAKETVNSKRNFVWIPVM